MVRALRNACYPIRWTRLKRVGYDPLVVMPQPQARSEADPWLSGDESLSDLPALVAATAQLPLAGAHGWRSFDQCDRMVVPSHFDDYQRS